MVYHAHVVSRHTTLHTHDPPTSAGQGPCGSGKGGGALVGRSACPAGALAVAAGVRGTCRQGRMLRRADLSARAATLAEVTSTPSTPAGACSPAEHAPAGVGAVLMTAARIAAGAVAGAVGGSSQPGPETGALATTSQTVTPSAALQPGAPSTALHADNLLPWRCMAHPERAPPPAHSVGCCRCQLHAQADRPGTLP